MKKRYFLFALLTLLQLSLFAKELPLTGPEITTRLTEDYPVEMPQLRAYPIYMNATADELAEITGVTIEINGELHQAVEDEGFYYYLWRPEAYGSYEIEMTAKDSDGIETTITRNIEVVQEVESQTVRSLEDVVIEFTGQNDRWFYGTFTFPQFVGAYNSIDAFLDVACPAIPGGCDDWDRWAFIDVKAPDGNWIQLIRYITPYGVACSHELNVTDYASLLQGEVEMRVFIDTWGTGGWQLTLDTHYTEGAPTYPYSEVVEIWDDSYWFGNPDDLQPVPTAQVEIPELIAASHLRVSNTGHNWGANNTGNAAEFYNATHYFDIDGEETFVQNLWNICNPNPDGCTGQLGTWHFSRAGWCPGAIAHPDIYDLDGYIGNTFDLDYRFHPTYVDRCHPNHPDCISGQTCPDCNDGANPIYYVDVQVINFSYNPIVYGSTLGTTTPIDNVATYDITLYPNPAEDVFQIQTNFPNSNTTMTIHTVDGQVLKTYVFNSSEAMNAYQFDVSNLSSGVYYINISNSYGTGTKTLLLN